MIKSAPPASANLAEMPVPAPQPTIGLPAEFWACKRFKISLREIAISITSYFFNRSSKVSATLPENSGSLILFSISITDMPGLRLLLIA